jgi:hypothetical protein
VTDADPTPDATSPPADDDDDGFRDHAVRDVVERTRDVIRKTRELLENSRELLDRVRGGSDSGGKPGDGS